MSGINYKADDVGAPSLYGIDGTSGGVGGLTFANIAASSASITLSAKLRDKWVTIVPNGAKIFIRFGKSGDSLTAVLTDVPIADGEKFHFRVTDYTQKFAFIGTGAVTNGLSYWCSENSVRPATIS